MRYLICMFTFCLLSLGAIAQRVGINAEGGAADSSATLFISKYESIEQRLIDIEMLLVQKKNQN